MGSRTYIYGDGTDNYVCMGKLVAYVDPDTLPNLKEWCDKNITNEDDRTYLFGGIDELGQDWDGYGYFDIGYCHESIDFHQNFNRQQIAEFITAYIKDDCHSYRYFNDKDYIDIGKLLSESETFTIEWTEGG